MHPACENHIEEIGTSLLAVAMTAPAPIQGAPQLISVLVNPKNRIAPPCLEEALRRVILVINMIFLALLESFFFRYSLILLRLQGR